MRTSLTIPLVPPRKGDNGDNAARPEAPSQGKSPALGGAFASARASVSRVLSWAIIYLGPASPRGSSGTPDCSGTALHLGKDLAVSPPLKELVSVRTSFARRSKRQGLPATFLTDCSVDARTFLPNLAIRAIAKRAGIILPRDTVKI